MDNKLFFMLKYASQNIEFYKKYFENYTPSYNDFPIIDKDFLIKNKYMLKSDYHGNNIVRNWTSGTTGSSLMVEWKYSDYQKSYFQLWKKRGKWYSICPANKCLTFHSATMNEQGETEQNMVLNNNVLSIRKDAVVRNGFSAYFDTIDRFQPEWILATPSMCLLLLSFLEQNHLNLRCVKYIELNGETLHPNVHRLLIDFFKVPIANLYGAIEFNGIALTCNYGTFHILDENVYLESKNGSLIITSLTNSLFPIIRYRIGDLGEMAESDCQCELGGKTLHGLIGRETDLLLTNDKPLAKSIFIRIIEEINLLETKILQYQIVVFKELAKVEFRVLVRKKYYKEIELSKKWIIERINQFTNLTDKSLFFDIYVCVSVDQFLFAFGEKIQDVVYK